MIFLFFSMMQFMSQENCDRTNELCVNIISKFLNFKILLDFRRKNVYYEYKLIKQKNEIIFKI